MLLEGMMSLELSHRFIPDQISGKGSKPNFFCRLVTPTKETTALFSGSFVLEAVSALSGLADGSKHK